MNTEQQKSSLLLFQPATDLDLNCESLSGNEVCNISGPSELPTIPQAVLNSFRPADCHKFNFLPVSIGLQQDRQSSEDQVKERGFKLLAVSSPPVVVVTGDEHDLKRAINLEKFFRGNPLYPLVKVAGPDEYCDVRENFEKLMEKYCPCPLELLNREVVSLIPSYVANSYKIIPVAQDGDNLMVLEKNSLSKDQMDVITLICGREVTKADVGLYKKVYQHFDQILEFYYRPRLFTRF